MRTFLFVQISLRNNNEGIVGVIDADDEKGAAKVIEKEIDSERISLFGGIKEYVLREAPQSEPRMSLLVLRETKRIISAIK